MTKLFIKVMFATLSSTRDNYYKFNFSIFNVL